MSAESPPSIGLEDLKLLPAWLKESPDARQYEQYEGDTTEGRERRPRARDRDRRPPPRDGNRDGRGPRRSPDHRGPRPEGRPSDRRDQRGPRGKDRHARPPGDRLGRAGRREERPAAPPKPPPEITVRFVPQENAFDSIATQIKADALAYSVFSLARLFLQKPERYDVHLAAKAEQPMLQLGENGAISADRHFLESNAFRLAQNEFYKIDITQSEPVKGNFTSIARDRLSGTLLGPTNHHAYQPRLRSLYEQRFSRRMSFADYQRQIEIVNDPALVEQWKEEARTVTTFTTLKEEPPVAFPNVNEAEKHFRQHYLPGFVRNITEITVPGVASRNLPDHVLRRLIENAWSVQTRSPSQMMQELSTRLREHGLHIFRHRKGMLFVSPIRIRAFVHEETSVSPLVKAILETVGANPKINRKDLAEKLLADAPGEEAEARKMSLASDLKWLVSEGYVIEFNDGSLDLPRTKPKKEETAPTEAAVPSVIPADNEAASSVEAAAPAANEAQAPTEQLVGSTESRSTEEPKAAELEIGGS